MEIHTIIKNLRINRQLTQVDVASQLKCNRQKIADWERGKSTPSAEDIVALTKVFGVSADYLLGISEAATLNKDIQAICEYTGLSSEAIETICVELLGDDIRAVLNIFLKGYKGNSSFKRTDAFRSFCNSIQEYRTALYTANEFLTKYYDQGITLSDLSLEDRENLFTNEQANKDRVYAAEYKVQKCALNMLKQFGDNDLQSQFEHDKLSFMLDSDGGEQDGNDQETQ